MEGYDTQHTGQCPYDTSTNTGTLEWKFKTGGWIVSSPAVAADGTVYVGSRDEHFYAVNPDGTLRSTYKTGWPNAGPFHKLIRRLPTWLTAGLDEITTAPVFSAEGTVYIGSNNNYLYALNADGTLKWKFETGDGIFSSPRISRDGTAYAGSWDGCLYALGGVPLLESLQEEGKTH